MSETAARQTSKSIFRNILYGFLTWLLPLGLSFVATPVIVRALGNRDYGIYALVLGFIGYSFTFNMGRAITKYIAEYRVRGESKKIRDVISVSLILNAVIGLIGVVTICSLASWLVRDVFEVERDLQGQAITAMYIAAGVIFFSTLNQVFGSIIQGVQRFDVYSKIFTASSFALILGNLVLAYSGYGLISLLLWNLVVLGVSASIYGFAAVRLLPEFGISFHIERETLRSVLKFSSGVIAVQITANLLLLFERGWITQRLGSESLTYYVVPLSLGMQLHAFVVSLVLVIFPLASELSEDRERLLKLYTKASKTIQMLVVFVFASVATLGSEFLTVWMGQDFATNSSDLLIIHIACFGLISIMAIAWQMTEGLGHPQFNALITGISTVIGIGLMFALTTGLANTGVAIARLAGFASIFVSVFVVERWFFGKVQVNFWARNVFTLGISASIAAFVEYLISLSLPLGWASFGLSVTIGGIAYACALWLMGYVTKDERELIKRILVRSTATEI